MATSGQVKTNVEYDSYFWIRWEQVGDQDVVNNKTQIKWSCGLYSTHKFYSNAIKMSAFSINGTQVYSGGTYSNFDKEGDQLIASGTMWIAHGTDGTKTFTISAFTGWLYSSHNYSASATNHSLTQIPRKATITAAADFTDMDNPTISFSNPGGFPIHVWLEPNPNSTHLCIRENIPNTGKYTWNLSDAERDQLRNSCPENSCLIRFGLYTDIGDVRYSHYRNMVFRMTENPATRPTVTVSLSPDNSALPGVFDGLYVQGKSKVNVALSAEGKYKANIQSYSATVEEKNYASAKFISGVITKSGTMDVTGYATDSRGFTGSASKQITVVPYTVPWITSFSVERQDDGTTVIAHLKGGVSPVENKNTKNFSVTLNGVTQSISTGGYNVDETVAFTDVPTDATLVAEAKITDAFATATKDATLPTVAVTMDFHYSGSGIAMGKVAEEEGVLDVAWDIKYKGNIIADFVVEENASGNWAYRKWNSGKSEAWLTKEISFTATPAALLGGYYASTSMGLPGGVFEQPPTCIAIGRIGTGIGFASVGSTTSTSTTVSVFGNQNGTTSYITALYATGQWK